MNAVRSIVRAQRINTRAVELKIRDLPEASWNMGDPFTNLQDGLRLASDLLARHPSNNQQIVVITDGQPTAYFLRGRLYCEWPLSFGVSTRVDLGNTAAPGAISFTWIETDDATKLQQDTQEIVTALASDPAFIGFRSMTNGNRFCTFTLWTSPQAAEAALARNAPHNRAMDEHWQHAAYGGLAGFTSIWQPYRLNDQFGTCTQCAAYVRIHPGVATAACECGGTVEAASYL